MISDKKIVIIDYKAGNAASVLNAVMRVGYNAVFARQPQDLVGATHIILPGVGSAGATMESLREMNMIKPLEEAVLSEKVFFLGICVGMQILYGYSEEKNSGCSGNVKCLGWLKGRVVRYNQGKVRIPQMGWNRVDFKRNLLTNKQNDYFYFVNSYHVIPENNSDVWGQAEYGEPFTAAVQKGNIFATQFHIEKSGRAGLDLLSEYLYLKNVAGAKASLRDAWKEG